GLSTVTLSASPRSASSSAMRSYSRLALSASVGSSCTYSTRSCTSSGTSMEVPCFRRRRWVRPGGAELAGRPGRAGRSGGRRHADGPMRLRGAGGRYGGRVVPPGIRGSARGGHRGVERPVGGGVFVGEGWVASLGEDHRRPLAHE